MTLGTRSDLVLTSVKNLCFTHPMNTTSAATAAPEDIAWETVNNSPTLTNEARGWAMDAYDLASLPSAARALELIRNGYAGGIPEFVRNSSALISN